MRQLPPLAAVRVFDAAARLQNFTRAADELGMTQAAVSYQIKLLEERLGLKLFRREGRAVVLTDAGRQAAPLVASGFDSIEEAFRRLRAEDEAVLTISAPNTFSSNWLAPRLGRFQLTQPGLAIRLKTSDAIVDFARDGIDAGIRGGRGRWPGLAAEFLMRIHYTPMASPDFLARHPVDRPEDLIGLPLLSFNDVWWDEWFDTVGIGREERHAWPGIRLDGQMYDGNAALNAQGIAILMPNFWRRELEAGRLVRPLPDVALDPGSFWFVRPEGRMSRKVRQFRDWMFACIAEEATDDPNGIFVAPDQASGSA